MAPSVDPVLIEIFPWPMFQAVYAGMPVIGGKLYGFVPSTSTPKAMFFDPFLTNPHEHPTLLDDNGAATIYLDGNYDLRLYNATDELLWHVENYTFSTGTTAGPGVVQIGTTQLTLTAIDNAAVLTAAGIAPYGYRVLGALAQITSDFGTSHGLTGLSIGDSVAADRWGVFTTLTATTGTTQQDFHAGDCPVAHTAYNVLVAASGGLFDGAGAIELTAIWEVFSDSPGTAGIVETGSAAVTLPSSDGAAYLQATGLVPLGARVLGVTTAITSDFGTSKGLTGLLIGDALVIDRWGSTTVLTTANVTTQASFRAGDCPISQTSYTVLVSADGGLFDASGELTLTVFWATIADIV